MNDTLKNNRQVILFTVFLWVYEVLWLLLLPLALLYLWYRGKKEPLYRQFIAERFGRVNSQLNSPIWIHSASLGELRGAAPWMQALLADNQQLFITTLTPAGRSAAQTIFADAIATKQLQVGYAPMESRFAIRRFLNGIKPKAVVTTEIDTWPVMLSTIKKTKTPLAMGNAQYPATSFSRDLRWGNIRSCLFTYYDLILCKSSTHAKRFEQVGCRNVNIVGETRFDMKIPEHQLKQANALQAQFNLKDRPVICFASVIEGEDSAFIDAFKQLSKHLETHNLPKPLCLYIPRSPQRFNAVYSELSDNDWEVLRRSVSLSENLDWQANAPTLETADILLGDSLGEMYFYLALSDAVVVGGSFVDSGAHNVIEPLSLRKPVWVGSSIWGIEYPGVEAIASGILQQANSASELAASLGDFFTHPQISERQAERAAEFYKTHAGSTEKHMAAFMPWLKAQSRL